MIQLNQELIKYLNKEAYVLVGLLQETNLDDEEKKPQDLEGSSAHLPVNDWSDKIVGPAIFKDTILGKATTIKKCYEKKCIGLNEESYSLFEKYVNQVYKNKEIQSVVSREFVFNCVFHWILEVYKSKQAKTDFVIHLLEEINIAIKEYRIHYPIMHLNIKKPFEIGLVKVDFFTKEFFNDWSKHYAESNPNEENAIEIIRDKHQGKVTASCLVKAELNKAKEIALERCSLAIDVLKIFSLTLDVPDYKISFDIDVKTNKNAVNEIFIQDPIDQFQLTYSTYFAAERYKIPVEYMIYMKQRGMAVFHTFLHEIEESEITELDSLIMNSIKRFSTAFSMSNLHDRVVAIYTILESLLLPSQEAPILDSLCKYLPKIISKDVNVRKKIAEILKSMYKVRSSLIHHGKEIDFDINDLKQIQDMTFILLYHLIYKRKKHKNKKSILDEIDDAINAAY